MFAGDEQKMQPQLLKAHRDAYKALKSGPGKFPVGVNLAIIDDQAVGTDSQLDKKRQECYAAWLDAAAQSDYVGVQTYGRSLIGKDGPLPPPAGAELTQMGEEFYPHALANTIRYAAAATVNPCTSLKMASRPRMMCVASRTSKPRCRELSNVWPRESTCAATFTGPC